MGLTDLQSHFTQNIPSTVESVDLLKIAQGARSKRNEQFKLVVDGECCLDRLYGGYFPDWICGGQWNKMEQFLGNFASVVQNSNLDLLIVLNGCLEPERLEDWKKRQEESNRFVEEIQRHVNQKKKPPPKVWWIPPAYLRSAVRLAFRSLQMKTMCTLEDHHKEVVQFCQRNGNNFQGVVADDPEYLVFDIPRYFSAQKLKLTFKGSLETVELKLKKVYESLNLPREKFHIFAALLGNHILSETDLSCFLSSLDVDSASKTSVIEKVGEFAKSLTSCDIDKVAELISAKVSESETDAAKVKDLSEKVTKCLRYYSDPSVAKSGNTTSKDKKNKNKASKKPEQKSQKSQVTSTSTSTSTTPGSATVTATETQEPATEEPEASGEDSSALPLPSDSQKLEADAKLFSEAEAETEVPVQPQSQPITNGGCSLAETAESGSGSGQSKSTSTLEKLLYRVNPEIETVCTNRHKNGLMSPYIYQIFKHREIKLPVIIQKSKEPNGIPNAHELFRPLRQRVYAILFNLHHLQFLAKQRTEKIPSIQVKETYFCPQTKAIKTDIVHAVEVGWGVPTVERLWLGEKEDCKRKRTRAFLAIMKSDKPIVLDSTYVPQQMLVLTCVLRYILSSEKKVLRKNELEALIAQAFIQDMTDPSIAQDIEVTNLTMRGVHLSHLFMEGIEMALLANDACGAPVPYMLFCPWLFFNGKVFNYVLEQQSQGKSLAEICGYKMDLVFNVDQLRLAATESVKVQYASAPNPTPFLVPPYNAPLMNHIINPQSRVPYLQGQIGSQPANLSQLAAAANAAANRNRLLGHNALQSNPFAMVGQGHGHSATNAALQGLYGNYPGGLGVGVGSGLSGMSTRVPIYNDIPINGHGHGLGQRQQSRGRIPPRGGQLEVAGMVVGSWGANYGPNVGVGLTNSLTGGGHGRNRIPMGPAGAYLSQNYQNLQMNSLFDQMRISGKMSNVGIGRSGGGGAQQNVPWHQRKNNQTGRNQKKPTPKKDVNSKGANSTNTNGSGPAKNSSTNKPKAVSFKEESQKVESGAGDASSIVSGQEKVHGDTNQSSPVNADSGVKEV